MKTRRIRIPVAISPTGNWSSCSVCNWQVANKGRSNELAGEALRWLQEEEQVNARVVWLEAEVMVPEAETVEAEVHDGGI